MLNKEEKVYNPDFEITFAGLKIVKIEQIIPSGQKNC
jgi:hypothetical protein